MKPIITGMKRLLTKQLDELNDFELVMVMDKIENSSIELVMNVGYSDYDKRHRTSYKILVDGYSFSHQSYLSDARKEYNDYLKCVRSCQGILTDVPLVYRVKWTLPTSIYKINNEFDDKKIPRLQSILRDSELGLENVDSTPKTIISTTKEDYEAQIIMAKYLIKLAEEKQSDIRKNTGK